MPAQFDLQSIERLPTQDVINLWVDTAAGSDAAAGTQVAPVKTLSQAFGRLITNPWGRRAVINLAPGFNETYVGVKTFPPIIGSGQVDDFGLDGVDPSWDFLRDQIMVQAAPITVQDITGTVAYDATCGLATVTVAGAGWTTDQWVGYGLLNPGFPAEYGMIWGNNATQLFVANLGYSDGTLRIVRRDATLTVGDPAAFDPIGFRIAGTTCSVALVGLKIAAAAGAGPALDILTHGPVNLLLCEIVGGLQTRSASNTLTVDACYLHGGSWAPNAGSVAIRQSYMQGMTTAFHAVNGQYDVIGCRIKQCGSMGHGGTSTPHGGFRIDNTWISDGTSHGVQYRGGNRSRITSTRIETCAANAIDCDGKGTLLVSTVTGSGNGGGSSYGANIGNGTDVNVAGVNTVVGGGGQVRLGGSTYTWAQAPQVDPATFSRFGA